MGRRRWLTWNMRKPLSAPFWAPDKRGKCKLWAPWLLKLFCHFALCDRTCKLAAHLVFKQLSTDLKIKIPRIIILPIYFVCVWNFVFHIKGRTDTQNVWENGAEENVWAQESQWQHHLHPSADVIGKVKSRRIRWAEHVLRMEGMSNAFKPEWRGPFQRHRILLSRI
jgi:hypothetical protein